MKKILAILVMFMSINIPAFAATDDIYSALEHNVNSSYLSDFFGKVGKELGVASADMEKFKGDLHGVIYNSPDFNVDNVVIKPKNSYKSNNKFVIALSRPGNLPVNSGSDIAGMQVAIVYDTSTKLCGQTSSSSMEVAPPSQASILNGDTIIFKVTKIDNNPVNYIGRPSLSYPMEKSFNAKYIVEAELGMQLDGKEDSIDNIGDKTDFSVKPLFTANLPYKVTVNHDSKLDGTEINVGYTFTDTNATSVVGNILNYNFNVSNTEILVRPSSDLGLSVGNYKDTLDLVVSPQ